MVKDIGVGAIVGLTFVSSVYVWKNKHFSTLQKIVLYFCIIFPPAQWIGILIILIYNNYKENKSIEKVSERNVEQVKAKLNSSIQNLTDLRDKGILTDKEYYKKVAEIKTKKAQQEIQNSVEYRQLKSLKDSGVLTQEEFENKLKLIKVDNETKINLPQTDYSSIVKSQQKDETIINERSFTNIYIYSIVFFLILIVGTIIYNNMQNENQYYPTAEEMVNVATEDIEETSGNNAYYQEEIKIKKFVYVVFKIKVPKLVSYTTGGYEQFDFRETHHYTNWEELGLSTEIIEVDDYTEDNKNRILDQTASKMDIEFNTYNGNYLTEILTKCSDIDEREKLNKEKSQIIEQNIYSFDSYSEASMAKRNL